MALLVWSHRSIVISAKGLRDFREADRKCCGFYLCSP